MLLFGPHARGISDPSIDYQLLVVADCFLGVPRARRSIGLRDIYYAGGGDAPLDLICLTSDEFARAKRRIALVSSVVPESIELVPVDNEDKLAQVPLPGGTAKPLPGLTRRGRRRESAITNAVDGTLRRFAERLQSELGARRVLLFGSHARGTASDGGDYDLIVVADRFQSIPRPKRAIGLRDLFYEVGGQVPLDLICLTPEEFEAARRRISLVAAVLPEAIDLLPPEVKVS